MSAVLPQDLLNIASTEIQPSTSTDHADIRFERAQILHMFWKVHAVRFRVSRHVPDERSRNLFWRTWSDPKLSTSISTSTLTTLWDGCRADLNLSPFDLVVTCPLEYSGASADGSVLSSNAALQQCQNHGNKHEASNLIHNNQQDSPPSTRTQEPQHDTNTFNPPQTSNSVDGSHKAGQPARPKAVRSPSVRNLLSGASAAGREKGGMKGRTRPSLGRRRSTQSGKVLKSPTLDSAETQSEVRMADQPASNVTRPTIGPNLASSWEDEVSVDSGRVTPTGLSAEATEFSVSKDFRGRFAERIASTSNLAGMSKIKKTGSVVRFADEVPGELSKVRQPLSTTFEDESRPLSRPPLPHRQSACSVAISDGDANEDEDDLSMPGLQRTASSLSMLLRTAQLENGSLPAESSAKSKQSKNQSKGSEKGMDEEELLAMGRKGGVTKAGGIQLRPEQQLRDDIDSGFSTPSPEPIF